MAQAYTPRECAHTETYIGTQMLLHQREEARRKLLAAGTDEKLWEELAGMTRDAQQFGEEV
jgi:hypothetical protein